MCGAPQSAATAARVARRPCGPVHAREAQDPRHTPRTSRPPSPDRNHQAQRARGVQSSRAPQPFSVR
eukprot:6721650-Prymnesium_polylepis.1